MGEVALGEVSLVAAPAVICKQWWKTGAVAVAEMVVEAALAQTVTEMVMEDAVE